MEDQELKKCLQIIQQRDDTIKELREQLVAKDKKDTVDLIWETIKSDGVAYYRRAKVFGGWLVETATDVLINLNAQPDGSYQKEARYEWRVNVIFVPDPQHEWK